MKRQFELNTGEKKYSDNPVLEFIESNKDTFVWIGNNASNDMRCYATFEGKKLQEFALKLLYAIGGNFKYKDMKVTRNKPE